MNETHYNYIGVTAYFENNDETNFRLRALATVLPGLTENLLSRTKRPLDSLQNTTSKAFFKKIGDAKNDEVLVPEHIGMLPEGATFQNQFVHLGFAEIDMEPYLALYIPVVSTDAKRVADITENALYPTLLALFGENLVSIETKSGTNKEQFDNLLINEIYR